MIWLVEHSKFDCFLHIWLSKFFDIRKFLLRKQNSRNNYDRGCFTQWILGNISSLESLEKSISTAIYDGALSFFREFFYIVKCAVNHEFWETVCLCISIKSYCTLCSIERSKGVVGSFLAIGKIICCCSCKCSIIFRILECWSVHNEWQYPSSNDHTYQEYCAKWFSFWHN